MGDMADYILSTSDPFDEEWPGEYYGEPTKKVCRYCQLGGLHWGMTDKGWRLFGDDNKLHRCQPSEAKQRFLQKYTELFGESPTRRTTVAIRQRQVVYVTDRGQEFVIQNMKATHLLNTIAHINKQIDALNDLPAALGDSKINLAIGYLDKRVQLLVDSRNMLAQELATRDPDKDEAYEDENCTYGETY